MSKDDKIKIPSFKPKEIPQEYKDLARIIESPHFIEKDPRAREFLKKHPIPKDLLHKK